MPGSGYARRLGADPDQYSIDDLIAARLDQVPAAAVAGEDVLFGPCPPWPTVRWPTVFGPEGFEAGIPAGWAATGGTVDPSGAQAYSGASSALVTVVGTPTQAILRGPAQPVVQGQLARVQAQVYAPAGAAQIQIAIDWYLNGVYQSTSVTDPVALAAATWTALDLSVAVPAGCNSAQYGPTLGASPAAGTLLYIDQVTLSLTTIVSAVIIPYAWIADTLTFRTQQPINDVTVSRTGGATASYTNTASIAAHTLTSQEVALESLSDGDPPALVTWYGTYYADPRDRITGLTVRLFAAATERRWRVLSVGVGDRIWVPDAPATWPQGSNLLWVEGVRRRAGRREDTVIWSTSPVIGPTPGMSGPWFELDETDLDSSIPVPF